MPTTQPAAHDGRTPSDQTIRLAATVQNSPGIQASRPPTYIAPAIAIPRIPGSARRNWRPAKSQAADGPVPRPISSRACLYRPRPQPPSTVCDSDADCVIAAKPTIAGPGPRSTRATGKRGIPAGEPGTAESCDSRFTPASILATMDLGRSYARRGVCFWGILDAGGRRCH